MSRLTNGLRFVPGDEGDVFYRAANGDLIHLPIPADYAAKKAAGTPYRLTISDAGVPEWAEDANAGSGVSPVTVEDGMGGFELTYTEGGEVIYA